MTPGHRIASAGARSSWRSQRADDAVLPRLEPASRCALAVPGAPGHSDRPADVVDLDAVTHPGELVSNVLVHAHLSSGAKSGTRSRSTTPWRGNRFPIIRTRHVSQSPAIAGIWSACALIGVSYRGAVNGA